MNKILFVGTSFLGSVKQGWEKLALSEYHATFIGLNAPALAFHLTEGWKVQGQILQFSPEFECFVAGHDELNQVQVGTRTFPGCNKHMGFSIDLTDFDSIAFVDMFYRIRIRLLLDSLKVIRYNSVPISRSMLTDMNISGFNGWIRINKHPIYGEVPFRNVSPLLCAVRDGAVNAKTFLIAAPRPPQGQLDVEKAYGGVQGARDSFNYIENFYREELAKLRIQYLCQPHEVLAQDGYSTDHRFSRGVHPTKPGLLDEHMNEAYGEIIARDLVSILGN